MARHRPLEPQPSACSPNDSSTKSLLLFRAPNLGDKLHRLALLSPTYISLIEVIVDTMLKRVDEQQVERRVRFLVPIVLALCGT